MSVNDEWEKALNGYANIKWNPKQKQPKSPVGDVKKSDERYEPLVGGLINGLNELERTAYQALGGINAQLAGWSANQQTRHTGDIERYKQSYENNPVLRKTAMTPEEYEKRRLENPSFWGQVLGGVDQKTKFTKEQAEELRQKWMLEEEKPWMDKANAVEDVRYTRMPANALEKVGVDLATNAPQLGEAALSGAALGSVLGPAGSALGAGLSMAKNIYGAAYGDERRKGRSIDASHGAAVADTLYQMPFEYVGASRIFKAIPGLRRAFGKLSPQGKSKFGEWLKTVRTEGSTEFLQQYGDSSADDIADAIETGKFQQDFEAGAKAMGNIAYENAFGENAGKNLEEAAYAGLLGGIMGGATHGAGMAIDALGRKLAGNPNITQADLEQAVDEAGQDIAQDGDSSFGNDALNFLANQTDVQLTEGQARNLAAAMAGNAFQESGYDSTVENGIGAYGSFQHLGDRKDALFNFAEENGLDPSSRQAQIAFAWKEMMTEGTLENQAFQEIMALGDNQPEAAAVIFRKLFERPGEEEANDEARMAEARRVHDRATKAREWLTNKRDTMDMDRADADSVYDTINQILTESTDEQLLEQAKAFGFREEQEKDVNDQRQRAEQSIEQNAPQEAPKATPQPQGQTQQAAPIAINPQEQAQSTPAEGMATANRDRTAPHIDRNKANKGNFNSRGNYNGRLDAPQNKRVEPPIRNQGQSAPILQQGENQNAENLQTQTTQRRENRENLNENTQPQQTQTAENQATPQNPQGNEVTPTLAPSNQGAAGIAQNMSKIASNGQNEIASKVNGEALIKATEGNTGAVSGESENVGEQGIKRDIALDRDGTVSAFKKAVNGILAKLKAGNVSQTRQKLTEARNKAIIRIAERKNNKEISEETADRLENRIDEIVAEAKKTLGKASSDMLKEAFGMGRGIPSIFNKDAVEKIASNKKVKDIVDKMPKAEEEKQSKKAENNSEAKRETKDDGKKDKNPNKEETAEAKETPQKEEKTTNETADKENTEKAEKTVKEEAKAPQEKPQKTKAQQKADAEKDAKAKKLLTKDAYDKVYTPLVNVLEQAQPDVAKAARDTALLMAKTADILHKRFKMKWENAPRVLLGGAIFNESNEYYSPAYDVSRKVKTLSAFRAKYIEREKQGESINKIRVKINGVNFTEERIRHIDKKHHFTDKQLDDLAEHIDTIYDACKSGWQGGNYTGQYAGIHVIGRVEGILGSYFVAVTVRKDGDIYFDTAVFHKNTQGAKKEIEQRCSAEVLSPIGAASNGPGPSISLKSLPEMLGIVKKPTEFNQIAWHGSPHSFNSFDLSKIGSGEGAQAHGWGLYFAQDEEISKGYKERLSHKGKSVSRFFIDGVEYKPAVVDGLFEDSRTREIAFAESDPRNIALLSFKDHWDFINGFKFKTVDDAIHTIEDWVEYQLEEDGETEFPRETYENAIELLRSGAITKTVIRNTSRLYKVDIPENDVLLDEQKGFSEQPEFVQKALQEFWEGEKNRLEKKIQTATVKKVRMENWAENIDIFINDGGVFLNSFGSYTMSGRDFVENLQKIYGAKEASLILNKYGIKGITYDGRRDGRCFVIFDDKAIKILETYEQQIKDQVAGSYNAVENLIKVFEKGNASTAVHESAHWYLVTLENLLYAEAEKRGIAGTTDEILEQLAEDETMPKDLVSELQKIRNWAQYSEETMKEYEGTELEKEFSKLAEAIKNGDEDAKERFIQERFARGYERYLASGKAPTKELQGVFARFRRWLLDIYNNTIKNLGNKPAPKEIQEIFDRMLEMEEAETNTRDTSGEAVKEKSKAKKNYPSGKTVNARTDKADEFPVTYKLIPIEDAITSTNEDFSINENFPQELQPRDRDRSGMKNQIKDIAGNLSPEEMTIAVKVSEGAPVINQDNIVENGNGRILALLRAYKGGSDAYNESAKRYKAYLREHAADFGFTAEQVDAIERPLLVRQRGSESDNLQRNIVESTSGGMKMSAGQQAKVDAKKISLHTLSLYNYDGSGDLNLASNGRFIKAVLDETISQYDQDSMFTADGSISRDAKNRVNNALCALAYGDTDLLDRVSESSDNDYKNYVSAYTIAAPRVAYAKKLMENGDVSKDFDVSKMLIEALDFVMQCKKENVKVSEKLRAGAGLFAGGSSQFEMDGSREFTKFLGNNIRKQRKMADTIKEIADGVIKKAEDKQNEGFFGGDDNTFYDIVRGALGMSNTKFVSDDNTMTLTIKDDVFDGLFKTQVKGLTNIAQDHGGAYNEDTHVYTFPDEISLEEAREEMDALLDPTKGLFSVQGKRIEKMQKEAVVVSESTYTEREKGLAAFASKMGVKLRFFEGDPRLHGWQSGDTIFLNRNSAKDLNKTFWHEAFHWLKRNNPKLYEALEKAVLQNDDIAAQVKAWQEKTGRTNLTEEEAIEEMLADAMLDAATRGKFFETLGITHPTLVQKLIKWIKNTYRALVDQFRHTKGFKPEAGLTNTQIDRMSKELDKVADKLVDGNGNKLFSKDAKENLKENTVKDVQYVDSVKYLVTNKNLKDTDSVEIVDIPTFDEKEDFNVFVKRVATYLKDKELVIEKDAIKVLPANHDDRNHFAKSDHPDTRNVPTVRKAMFALEEKIDELFAKGVYVEEQPDKHIDEKENRKPRNFVQVYAAARYKGEVYRIKLTGTKRITKAKKVKAIKPYNLQVKTKIPLSAIKKGASPQGSQDNNLRDLHGAHAPDTVSVPNLMTGVKDLDLNPYVINGQLQYEPSILEEIQAEEKAKEIIEKPKFSVDLNDLSKGKVLNDALKNAMASRVQEKMEIMKESDAAHYLGKYIPKQPKARPNVSYDTNYGKKKRDKAWELLNYGVLAYIRSPSRLANPIIKQIYTWAEDAKRTQNKFYSKWTEKHKEILDLVQDAKDYAGYVDVLLTEDSDKRVFSDGELRSLGYSDKVIKAHQKVRDLLQEIRAEVAKIYQAEHVETKNFKSKAEADFWAKNPMFKNVEVKAMNKENGTVWQVKYTTPQYVERTTEVNIQLLDELKRRQQPQGNDPADVYILEWQDHQEEITGATTFTVKYLESRNKLANLDQYIPHFFHEFLIIEVKNGTRRVVGSGTTLNEAVAVANNLAAGSKSQFFIAPKGFAYEDSTQALGIVGDKDLTNLSEALKAELEVSLEEAREAVKGNSHHIFLSALQHRKGAKGWETNMRWVIQHHISNTARYCALEPFKQMAMNLFERRFGSFSDSYSGKVIPDFTKGLINSVLGVPSKAEEITNAILSCLPIFENVPRPSRAVTSSIVGAMAVLKLGVSPAAAFINLTQFVNLQGYIGSEWTLKGMNAARNLSEADTRLLEELGTREETGLETVDVSEETELIVGRFSKELKALKAATDKSMVLFTKAESFLRTASILGAYRKALAEGKTERAARAYALEVNRNVNFNYGVEDAPRMFRALQGSVVGDMFLQFKKYGFKELEVIGDMLTNKNIPKSQKLMFFGEYFLLGGLFNSIPFQDLILALLGFALDEDDPEAEMKKWLMEFGKDNWAKRQLALIGMYGLGGAAGVDISQRVGFRSLVPEAENPFGVTGSTVAQVANALMNGDPIGMLKSTSPALGNLASAYAGYNTDSKGRVSYTYKDPFERVVRAAGFRTTGEALSVDKQRILNEDRSQREKQRKEAREAYFDNPSAENRRRLKELGYTDTQIKNLKPNDPTLERTERMRKNLSKREQKEFKEILEW